MKFTHEGQRVRSLGNVCTEVVVQNVWAGLEGEVIGDVATWENGVTNALVRFDNGTAFYMEDTEVEAVEV